VIVQMTGSGNEGQLSIAQIEARRLLGPTLESEKSLDFRHARRHQRGMRLVVKLVVARDVVVMTVRVGDHQLEGRTLMDGLPLVDDPLDDVADGERSTVRRRSGARIQQQRPVRAEEQVEERRLEVQALALAQDVGVLVERVDLQRRIRREGAIGRTVDPSYVEV